MECPYCGCELEQIDIYGRLALHQDGKIIGEIYECPNKEGFEYEEEAIEYLESINETLESLGLESYEELQCENEHGNAFYHTMNDELYEGYPC